MALKCPPSTYQNTLGCGVERCCGDVTCTINIKGLCVCASYSGPSPVNDGWDYSFMAQCSQDNVTGPLYGEACVTLLGRDPAYSCYCRPLIPGDQGGIGDQVPGNAIFNTDGSCIAFKATEGGSNSNPTDNGTSRPSSPSDAANRGEVSLWKASLLIMLLITWL